MDKTDNLLHVAYYVRIHALGNLKPTDVSLRHGDKVFLH